MFYDKVGMKVLNYATHIIEQIACVISCLVCHGKRALVIFSACSDLKVNVRKQICQTKTK